MAKQLDLLIIGGGVWGTALLYLMAKYTDVKRLGLVEKYDRIAALNSHGSSNSQTLHCGDIETNYTLEKALTVKKAVDTIICYAEKQSNCDDIIFKFSKMVLGVGTKECAALRERFTVFKEHYPNMRLLERADIADIEPNVALQQDQEIIALGSTDDYSGVNYAALAESFVENAKKETDKDITFELGCQVHDIVKTDEGFRVSTGGETFLARSVVVCAGAHSLLFAQRMGHGLEFSCLPVAGSFYFTPKVLNGKVYTVQNDVLPFAAIHGDPDVLVQDKTRFGPTALMLPMLERYNKRTILEFFKVLRFDRNVAKAFWGLLRVPDIRNYIFKNILFEVPFIRRRLFLHDARKIVPSLKLKDLTFAKGFGGIRPQLIDKKTQALLLGEAKISPGNGIIFNMTPSPGGTSCLVNAEKDLRSVVAHLGAKFDEERFNAELG